MLEKVNATDTNSMLYSTQVVLVTIKLKTAL